MDAYAIFLQARSAVTSAHYSRRIDYTIDVSGLEGCKPAAEHYRASVDPQDGAVRVDAISAEESAAPAPRPHGFNFALTATICGGDCRTGVGHTTVPVGAPPPPPDILGVPALTPTYMFGLSYRPARSASPQKGNEAIPVIAVVSTKTREYAVTVIDEPALDGVPTYHLRLTPLRKPKENRLRELWIGREDHLPRKALISGNFTIAPLVDVPWTVQFGVVNGAPFIVREFANATLYMPHRRVVRDAAIAFENVREPGESIVGEPLIHPDVTHPTLVEP